MTPAPASATAPAEEGAKPARARGPRTTDGRRRPGAKREPSKTKAAIAAAKRRARVKAERELCRRRRRRRRARGSLRRRARRGRRVRRGGRRRGCRDAQTHRTPRYYPLLPPSSHAVPTLDEETPLDPTSARGSEAAALADALRRSSLEIGAVHAFDAKEAALCDLRGWSDVIECEIHRVSPRGVDVRCRVDPSAAAGVRAGAARVPPNAALRVLGHREDAPARVRSTPSAAHGEAGVGGDSRVELARRRRAKVSSAGVERGASPPPPPPPPPRRVRNDADSRRRLIGARRPPPPSPPRARTPTRRPKERRRMKSVSQSCAGDNFPRSAATFEDSWRRRARASNGSPSSSASRADVLPPPMSWIPARSRSIAAFPRPLSRPFEGVRLGVPLCVDFDGAHGEKSPRGRTSPRVTSRRTARGTGASGD